jgi:hypothetical protein
MLRPPCPPIMHIATGPAHESTSDGFADFVATHRTLWRNLSPEFDYCILNGLKEVYFCPQQGRQVVIAPTAMLSNVLVWSVARAAKRLHNPRMYFLDCFCTSL